MCHSVRHRRTNMKSGISFLFVQNNLSLATFRLYGHIIKPSPYLHFIFFNFHTPRRHSFCFRRWLCWNAIETRVAGGIAHFMLCHYQTHVLIGCLMSPYWTTAMQRKKRWVGRWWDRKLKELGFMSIDWFQHRAEMMAVWKSFLFCVCVCTARKWEHSPSVSGEDSL